MSAKDTAKGGTAQDHQGGAEYEAWIHVHIVEIIQVLAGATPGFSDTDSQKVQKDR